MTERPKLIYLAGNYTRRKELLGYAAQLAYLGYTITSTWLYEDVKNTRDLEFCWWAMKDLEDINRADTLVVFSGVASASGGMHVELGYALGRARAIVLVGPRENIFHYLPGIIWFETWKAALNWFTRRLTP